MGMGIGTFLTNSAIFKRRYRWTLSFAGTTNLGGSLPKISPVMVALASRPSFTTEETELSFMNEHGWIPARPTWEPLSVTWLDFNKIGGSGADAALRAWLQAVYVFGAPGSSGEMSDPAGHVKRSGSLKMYNGVGDIIESWDLYGCWIQTANFGDLDYAATEICNVETQIRFDNADLKIQNGKGRLGATSPNSLAAFEADSDTAIF